MTFWHEVRAILRAVGGPLLCWLFFTGLVFGMIYQQMGRVPIPVPATPSCEIVTVTYRSPGNWVWEREEVQCQGPDGKVKIGW